jgi:hypothetical protein
MTSFSILQKNVHVKCTYSPLKIQFENVHVDLSLNLSQGSAWKNLRGATHQLLPSNSVNGKRTLMDDSSFWRNFDLDKKNETSWH